MGGHNVERDLSRETTLASLRLIAAPRDLDPAALSAVDMDRVVSRLTLVDLTYETERP